MTEWQKQVYSEYLKSSCDILKTSEKLNKSKNSISKIVRNIKKQNLNLVDCFSTSTLYDKDGNVVQKWVKSNNNKKNIVDLYKKYCEEYSQKLPRYITNQKQVKIKYLDNLIVYPIADLHIGMLSWLEETGRNYNTKIASEIIYKYVTQIIDCTPSCCECLICNLGDFLHVDNQFNKTERSGNILDVDGRYAKILSVGIKLMRYMIEYCLKKHKHVTVVNCIGNHDDLGSLWLSSALSNIYEKESRITIVNKPTQRQYYRYGNVLIGMTHGSDVKAKELPLIMASEKSQDWGETEFHYFYTGHWHKDSVLEYGNCKVESFRALCDKDAWTISKGYLSGRDIKSILIDKKNGEYRRFITNIKGL